MPTVSDLRSKNQAWKEVARHPPLSAGPAGPAGAAREEHLLLQRIAPAVGQHCVTSAHLRVSVHIWSPHELRPDESLLPPCLWPAGRGVCGNEALELLHTAGYEAALQTSHVFSRWAVTTWPVSLGRPTGSAGATLEGRPASSRAQPVPSGQTDLVHGSQRARWPIPPHYQGNQAPSVPLHRQRSRHPITGRHSPTPS